MHLEAHRAQLYALRAQVDAMILSVEADLGIEQQQLACPHEETEDEGTFGNAVTRCKACKAIVA